MRLRLGLATIFLALASGTAFSQAVVNGAVVYGNSSKPVPNVTVHLVNKNMHPTVDQIAKTGDDGSYSFDNVVPGEGYAVAVYDATGKVVGTDPSFSVSSADPLHTAVPDIDISRGLTQERANKSGGLIQNDVSVSPGANISNEQIRVLPLYNRNFLNLGLIQPGVHDVEQGSALQGAAFSIAGARSTSTYFLLDGVDNVAASTNQAIPFQVNEAVREFRVTYANPSLRYGQGSGGIVDVITSSGDFGTAGHHWHGSVFGYFNSDSLNGSTPLSVYSNTGFAKAAAFANAPNTNNSVIYLDPTSTATSTIPSNCNGLASSALFCGYSPQSYNALFGLLSSGSPIAGAGACSTIFCTAGAFNGAGVLAANDSHSQPITSKQFGGSLGGAVGKHAFLFGSYEGTLIDNPTPIFERVPTFLDRTTIPGLTTAAGSDQGIAQALLGLYPAANVGQTGSTLATNTGTGIFGFYRGTAPNYTHVHTVQVRPDILLGKLGSLGLRYTGQLLDQLHDDTLPANSAYPGNGADRRAQNQSVAISHVIQFKQSRNILNVAFTQYRVDEVAQDRRFNVAGTGLGLSSMPTIAISGIDPATTAPAGSSQGYMGGWYDSFWQTNCPAASGLGSCQSSSASQGSPSPITPSQDGNFPMARLGAPLVAPSRHRDTEAFVSDAIELHLTNKYTLMAGGDFRYQQNFVDDGALTRGLVVSNNIGEFTHDSETCVSCTPRSAFTHPSFDYELRQPMNYTGDLRSSSFGVFVENQFHPTAHTTLIAGARYELFGQPLDTQSRLWNYSFANGGLNRQNTFGTYDAFDYQCNGGITFFDAVYGSFRTSVPAGGANCKQGVLKLPSNHNDVTGMAGFSWAPGKTGRAVFRAAAGGYFDHAPASYNEKLLYNRPSPYNVLNPSAVYGQNFESTYSSPTCQLGTQCAFGLSTLNLVNAPSTNPITGQIATFQNYQAASAGEVLYARDSDALKTPILVQYSGSFQYRFSGSWNAEFGYVGSHGTRVPLVYDGNFTNEFYCQANGICGNNTYFPVFTQSDIGRSNYNSVVVRTEGRLWKGLSMHASYTWAKSLDDVASSDFPNATDSLFVQLYGRQLYGLGNPAAFALQSSSAGYGSNGGVRGAELSALNGAGSNVTRSQLLRSANVPTFASVQSALTTTGSRSINVSRYNLPQNPLAFSSSGATPSEDYGPSDFDVRHRGVADFVYHPPFLKGAFLRGFTLSGITTVQSGQPFTIFSGPAYNQITQRVNLSSTTPIKTTGSPTGYITGVTPANLPSLNSTSCPVLYAQPSLYKPNNNQGACLGNSGRNAFTGPAYFSQDLALQHSLRVHEGNNLVLRAEFFNLFNRANFYNPISEISADGVHINPEFGLIRSAHDPREIQFAVRYDF
ncbi:MAG TPA: carboxypeptidase-like regulatory domain-containing protein [Acidobacteriaceae bacterium]